jgi:hypothetical protein
MGQTIPTISKLFSDIGNVSGGVNITSVNDSIYFSIYTQDGSSSYQYIDFIKTDSHGAETNRLKIKIPGYAYSPGGTGSLKITSDGYLICGGNSGPFQVAGSGTFFKLDRFTLDTLYIRYYRNIHTGSDFFGLGELSDGNYLFSGREGDSTSAEGYNAAWMVKTDTAGNELWQKEMSSDEYNMASFTSPFEGGFYQFWVTYHLNTLSGDPADSAIFVDRYDNNGNLQWRDTFGVVGHDNIPGPFTATKDGGGLLFINKLDTINLANNQSLIFVPGILYKFDSTGAIVWERYFPAAPLFFGAGGILETKSGNIVMCGGAESGYISLDSLGHGNGAMFKLDKDGNLLFFQYYNYDSTSPSGGLGDITETADGGYACIGNAFENVGGTYYQKAWLLKVDSNGCLNGNCPTLYTGIQPIPDLVNFFVFPNPASSQFTVALAGPQDIYQYHNLSFSLYDLTGRLVQKQTLDQQTTVIQRGDLSAGLYVWELSDESGHITSGKISLR